MRNMTIYLEQEGPFNKLLIALLLLESCASTCLTLLQNQPPISAKILATINNLRIEAQHRRALI